MQISKWIPLYGYCACKVPLGMDTKLHNRIAFIEKTPRVKIPKKYLRFSKCSEKAEIIYDNQLLGIAYKGVHGSYWLYGPKGTGGSGDPESESTYGYDQESRDWCDNIIDLIYTQKITLKEYLSKLNNY